MSRRYASLTSAVGCRVWLGRSRFRYCAARFRNSSPTSGINRSSAPVSPSFQDFKRRVASPCEDDGISNLPQGLPQTPQSITSPEFCPHLLRTMSVFGNSCRVIYSRSLASDSLRRRKLMTTTLSRFVSSTSYSIIALALFTLHLPGQNIPGKFYEYQILSMNGQTPVNASQALTGLGAPSINSNGTVAYYGQFTGGEGIVAASPTIPATLISFAPPISNRFFGLTCQIDDAEQVL